MALVAASVEVGVRVVVEVGIIVVRVEVEVVQVVEPTMVPNLEMYPALHPREMHPRALPCRLLRVRMAWTQCAGLDLVQQAMIAMCVLRAIAVVQPSNASSVLELQQELFQVVHFYSLRTSTIAPWQLQTQQ